MGRLKRTFGCKSEMYMYRRGLNIEYRGVYDDEYTKRARERAIRCDICPMCLDFVSAMLLHRKNNIAGGYSIYERYAMQNGIIGG